MTARPRHILQDCRLGACLAAACVLSHCACGAVLAAQNDDTSSRIPPWPCRLVVSGTLRDALQDGWRRSATLQRQCRELADARAVVVLTWGSMDSLSRAKTRMDVDGGVVVASVVLPPVADAIALVAHELQHVLEKVNGVDFATEAKRPGSGVWQAFGGYETRAAIDAGRRAACELRIACP